MQDPNFQNKMKTRWDSLRDDELSNARITFLIDSMAAGYAEAQVRNYQQWPILGQYVLAESIHRKYVCRRSCLV